MAIFLDEKKAIAAIAEKLKIGPEDSAVSILSAVAEKAIAGKQAHVTITTKWFQADIVVKLESIGGN